MSTKTRDVMAGVLPEVGGIDVEGAAKIPSFSKKAATGFHGTATLYGFPVYYREPSAEDVEALATANNDFAEAIKRISRDSAPGKAPQTGKATAPKLSEDEAKEQSLAAIKSRQDAHYDVLKRIVDSWELPGDDGAVIPCTPEAIEDLPFNIAFELVNKIQQASNLGQEAARFLGDS